MRCFPPHLTDFYKVSHRKMYPEGTEYVYSNFTCRSDKLANVGLGFDHKVVFFGLQGVLQWLLQDLWGEGFFDRPLSEVLTRYQRRMDSSLGPGAVGTEHFEALWKLGYLPVLIKALPEGSRVDIRVPVFTIVNTHPDFFWLTNYLETQLSAEVWKPITSATVAHEYRRLLDQAAKFTGTDPEFVPWQGHDFSFRGMSGIFDAAQSGAGHLLSFTGTDTISAIDYLEDYYGGTGLIGGSVPASEHSVSCAGSACDSLDLAHVEVGELEYFRRMIEDLYPSGIVSCVADTYDFFRVVTEYVTILKEKILARDGKTVFRPDTGDPVKIVCGDPEAAVGSPEHKGAIECLWDVFGGTTTSQGYRLLDPHVGLIYGDSITLDRAERIISGLAGKGFASGNVVFGVGSFTYQFMTRDTFGSAIKATWAQIKGKSYELWKDPKTGDGMKKSARGLLRVEKEDGNYVLYDQQTPEQEQQGELVPVFRDGKVLNFQTLKQIRERLRSGE